MKKYIPIIVPVLSLFLLAVLFAGVFRGKAGNSAGYGLLLTAIVQAKSRSKISGTESLLLLLALSFGIGGWFLDLYHSVKYYDKFLHFLNPAILVQMIAFNRLNKKSGEKRFSSVVPAITAGIALGTIWEIIEWLATNYMPAYDMGDLRDTILDLVLDMAGSVVGALIGYRRAYASRAFNK